MSLESMQRGLEVQSFCGKTVGQVSGSSNGLYQKIKGNM